MAHLLVRVGETKEQPLAELSTEELKPHWQAVSGKARRHGYRGKADEWAQAPVVTPALAIIATRSGEYVGRNHGCLMIERRVNECIESSVRHDG